MQKAKRSLSELETRVIVLENVEGNNLRYIISIASTNSPSSVFSLASMWLTNCGFAQKEADEIAKAARWLAIIRRDYGPREFERITKGFTSTE